MEMKLQSLWVKKPVRRKAEPVNLKRRESIVFVKRLKASEKAFKRV